MNSSLFYNEEVAKYRALNDANQLKFIGATGVMMDKWDGGVDSLRKLLLAHETTTAARRLASKVFVRRPAGQKQNTPIQPKPKPVDISLKVKPDVIAKVTDALNPKEPEDAGEAEMDTEEASKIS